MNLLLDTHIWVWSVGTTERLSRRVLSVVQNPANEWCVSTASFWEVMVLSQKKRLNFGPDPATWIRETLATRPVRETPINREIAILSRALELGTEDPVDSFLAATALVLDLTLVTADEHLLACRTIRTLANR